MAKAKAYEDGGGDGEAKLGDEAKLADRLAKVLTVFGAGLQGRMHLEALSIVREWDQVWLVDIDQAKAERVAGQMSATLGTEIKAATYPERAVGESDVVVTITTGSGELVKRDWLKPGTLVCKMGSYQELDLEVITQADKLVVDSWEYVSHRVPELARLLDDGRLSRQALHAEWPDVVAGRSPGR